MPVPQERLEKFAAYLDRNPTFGEKQVAQWLRKWCQKHDIVWATQIAMHGYIVDFFFPQFSLVVELDGPQHNERRDALRDQKLVSAGLEVMRFPSPATRCDVGQIFFQLSAELRWRDKRRQRRFPPFHSAQSFKK